MAERIVTRAKKAGLDELLTSGDPSAVALIAKGRDITSKKGTEINFYSFATKYCSFHNPDLYPIYDSNVVKVLKYYRKNDTNFTFKSADLKENGYEKFYDIMTQFNKRYKLEQFSAKEIDEYLWQRGRELAEASKTKTNAS
jgi:hypothetical protein